MIAQCYYSFYNNADTLFIMQGVFTVDFEKGLTLTEVGEGVSVEDIKAATKCNFKVRVHKW